MDLMLTISLGNAFQLETDPIWRRQESEKTLGTRLCENQSGRHLNVIYESFSSWFYLPSCDLIKATRSCY